MTLAHFLRPFSRHGGILSSQTSGADRPLPGALPSFRAVRRGVRGAFRAGVRFFPVDRQGGRGALSRLRQPAVRVCPDPVSRLWGGAASYVLLPHQGILPIAFITEYAVVDRIIDYLKLTFAAATSAWSVTGSRRSAGTTRVCSPRRWKPPWRATSAAPAPTVDVGGHPLRVFADTPGFILNAGCAIPAETPPANLRAMIAAARGFEPRAQHPADPGSSRCRTTTGPTRPSPA